LSASRHPLQDYDHKNLLIKASFANTSTAVSAHVDRVFDDSFFHCTDFSLRKGDKIRRGSIEVGKTRVLPRRSVEGMTSEIERRVALQPLRLNQWSALSRSPNEVCRRCVSVTERFFFKLRHIHSNRRHGELDKMSSSSSRQKHSIFGIGSFIEVLTKAQPRSSSDLKIKI